MKISNYLKVLIINYFLILIWSAVNPMDVFTCFLETFPALFGFIILTLTYKKFRFTNLCYTFILIHCTILFVGGHYTYAEVPLFNWIRDVLDQSRNNFDKIGHLAQGLIPALLAREIMLRTAVTSKRGWASFLSVSIAMLISALYELLEWMVAVLTGTSADAFLGTQGYIWDTQSDMLFCLIGSLAGVILFSSFQDKTLKKITQNSELGRKGLSIVNNKGFL
jgi:putative membrane protein